MITISGEEIKALKNVMTTLKQDSAVWKNFNFQLKKLLLLFQFNK
jgi:hypothetical protein